MTDERDIRQACEEAVPVAWAYVNSDGECEQIDWGASDLSKMAGDPGITPLYTRPHKQPDQSARIAELEALLRIEREHRKSDAQF
jgi:hypothetical protein